METVKGKIVRHYQQNVKDNLNF